MRQSIRILAPLKSIMLAFRVYMDYTLPVAGLLLLVLWPCHSRLNTLKYTLACAATLTTLVLWGNDNAHLRTGRYRPKSVPGGLEYVPLEECAFYITVSFIAIAFTNLVMRWHLPSVSIKPNTPLFQSYCIRIIPSLLFLTAGLQTWVSTPSNTRLFYGSCILGPVCPVLSLLWLGAGEYVLRRWKSVAMSILAPTMYLFWVHKNVTRTGGWPMVLHTNTGSIIAPRLPVEEFAYFAIMNTMLVLIACAVDRADAILHLWSQCPVSSSIHDSQWTHLCRLTQAFFQLDQGIDNDLLNDITVTWQLFCNAPDSRYSVSALLPAHIRQDLGILYGFCRSTDRVTGNDKVPSVERMQQLHLIRTLVGDMFENASKPNIDWRHYAHPLPDECLCACRALSNLRYLLPLDIIEELLDVYAFDLIQAPVKDETTPPRYASSAASTVGEICAHLMLSDIRLGH